MKNDYLRQMESVRFESERLTDEFRRFVKREILPELDILTGYKQKQKAETACQIIANLLLASNRNKVVCDPRDTGKADVRLRVAIWDALVKHKLAICCKGSEQSAKVTRYLATNQLCGRLAEWKLQQVLNVQLERNTQRTIPVKDALVILKPSRKHRESKDQVLPIPDKDRFDVVQIEDQLDFINRANLRHSWQLFVTDEHERERIEQPNIMLQQQHSGVMFDWVRIYTPGRWGAQGLPKKLRRTMLIDGEQVAELDFKCSQIRLLYHLTKHETDPNVDLYYPSKVLPRAFKRRRDDTRCLVKLATTIAMNASNSVQASKAVTTAINKDTNLQGLLELENVNAGTLIHRVHGAHDVPFLPSMGPKLMTLETTIMLNVCMAFALQGSIIQRRELTDDEQLDLFGELRPGTCTGTPFGKPVLPIHDGLLCKVSEVEFAEQLMAKEYRDLMDCEPVIQREY